MNDDSRLDRALDSVTGAWDGFWNSLGDVFPSLIGAFLVLVLGIFLAKLLSNITKSLLKTVGLEKVNKQKQVKDALAKTGFDIDIVEAASKIVFWVVVLVTAFIASDVLNLTALSDLISDLLAYIPNIIAGILVLAVTLVGAKFLRRLVEASLTQVEFDYARGMGIAAQAVVIVFGSVFALAQLGFETTLLTANLAVIIAGVMLAGALAFGLGGRAVAGNLLAYQGVRSMLKVGDQVTLGVVSGTVESIKPMGVILKTSSGNVVVPNNKVMEG